MKLSELVKTTELRIPGETGDTVVQLKHELSWFDQLALTEIKDEGERGKFLALKMIDAWNITDDQGVTLPVTRYILEKLPAMVMLAVINRIVEMSNETEVKKKS